MSSPAGFLGNRAQSPARSSPSPNVAGELKTLRALCLFPHPHDLSLARCSVRRVRPIHVVRVNHDPSGIALARRQRGAAAVCAADRRLAYVPCLDVSPVHIGRVDGDAVWLIHHAAWPKSHGRPAAREWTLHYLATPVIHPVSIHLISNHLDWIRSSRRERRNVGPSPTRANNLI